MAGKEISELYLHELLRTFGMTLIGVFIPIYILSQGFSLLHAGLFIILSGFTGILLSYPLARGVARLGFRHSIAASYLLVIPGILLIRSLPLSLSLIVASSLLYNTGRVMHNVARNAEFATDSHRKSRNRESGQMLSIPNIARVIAPLLGGTVFAVFGFTELVGLSILILLLSLLPLLHTSDHTSDFDYSFRSLALEDHWRALPLFTI
ncbi:MAG: hypothetical protein SVU32_01965, partial [Candidatus Nanohaloarchaea archaeon]|nr:hypothetical protein [Candidatus Nanohaloarchaea archaeon]